MPLVFNQEAINGILFTLHFQKDTPSIAHQKLMEMAGEEVMNLDQVIEFFKKIDNGEFCLEEEVESLTLLGQVLNIPNFVGKYLDIDLRLRLRKTCKTIRKIINEMPLHIECLQYKCNGNTIEISTNEDMKIIYVIMEGNGLVVTNGNRWKFIHAENNEKQIKIIQRDLMTILCSQKLKIDTLRIENDQISVFDIRGYDDSTQIGKRALWRTLNQVLGKLQVRKLEYLVEEVDDLLIETLEKIDPEHLKFLQLRINRYVRIRAEDWEYLYNLEQWKRLATLTIRFPQLSASDILSFYTHFENALLEISDFFKREDAISKPDVVLQIKQKLLENPNLEQFIICASEDMSDSDFDDINASLQQYNINNAPYPCWISIPDPDSDKKLELLVKKKIIWFKGPCYVKGEWEEDSSDEDDEEDEDEEDEGESMENMVRLFQLLNF
ncbi:hypothetical protein CRE_22934 [Caenorhabditis remanei]|uniref:DUF38 domain-containing protein n=1 Tax=Caenorhabditis remanei TaxID=31234 RepID=E3MW65_CAERE|nr:hypothetical protein CRE_22934 [Caenorhabditis remanei]